MLADDACIRKALCIQASPVKLATDQSQLGLSKGSILPFKYRGQPRHCHLIPIPTGMGPQVTQSLAVFLRKHGNREIFLTIHKFLGIALRPQIHHGRGQSTSMPPNGSQMTPAGSHGIVAPVLIARSDQHPFLGNHGHRVHLQLRYRNFLHKITSQERLPHFRI